MHQQSSPKKNNGRDYTIRTAHRQPASTIIVLLITALLAAACSPAPVIGAPPTVKIGLVAPFEGLHRPLGYEALFAVKLALQEKNEAGGLNGYRVELVALNDFGEAGEAAAQAREMAADPDILGVIGGWSPETAQAAAPEYERLGLAFLVPEIDFTDSPAGSAESWASSSIEIVLL